YVFFFFSSRRRHTRSKRDWSSDVCSSDLLDELTENIPEEIKPIIHSDQGWHYQLNYYTDKLSEKNLYKACLVRETVLIMRQLKASFIFLKQNVLMDFHSVNILENTRKSQRVTSLGLRSEEYHRKQKA